MFEGWVNFIQEISLFFLLQVFILRLCMVFVAFFLREGILLFSAVISIVDSVLVQYLLVEYFSPL